MPEVVQSHVHVHAPLSDMHRRAAMYTPGGSRRSAVVRAAEELSLHVYGAPDRHQYGNILVERSGGERLCCEENER